MIVWFALIAGTAVATAAPNAHGPPADHGVATEHAPEAHDPEPQPAPAPVTHVEQAEASSPAAPAPPRPTGIEERVVFEGERVARLLSLRTELGLLLALAAAAGAGWLAMAVSARLRRAGLGTDRRVQAAQVGLVVFVMVWVVGAVARRLIATLPLLGTLLFGVFLSGLALWLSREMARTAGGLARMASAGVGRGTQLVVGSVSGKVERVGILRLRLRNPDGSVVDLPVRELDDVLVLAPAEQCPVALQVDRPGPVGQIELQRLRQVALLCPYRRTDQEVRLTRTAHDDQRLDVQLQSWSPEAARRAEAWLRRALTEVGE